MAEEDWSATKAYASDNYGQRLKKEFSEIKSYNTFEKISWKMFWNRKLVFWLEESGYRKRGIWLIKLLYFLQGCRLFSLEQAVIKKVFIK